MRPTHRALVVTLLFAALAPCAHADIYVRRDAMELCRMEFDAHRDACKQSSGAATAALKACRENAKTVYRDCTRRAKEVSKDVP